VVLDTFNTWVSSPLSLATQLGESVPRGATFFTNYVYRHSFFSHFIEYIGLIAFDFVQYA
jgi:hypothetical protein